MSGENEGTPDPMVENSPDTEAAAETNYEQRFKDTQAAFTKSQQALKDMESVWEDEDALVARIAEKFPHLVTEPEADTDDNSDSDFVPGVAPPEEPDPRLEALDKRAAALEAAEAERQYQADLNKLLGDREVDQTGRKFIRAACALGGDNYKALESAVSEFLELVGESSGSASKKNKAPAVIPNGQAVLGDVPDYDSMSQSERWDAMTARARALNNQS